MLAHLPSKLPQKLTSPTHGLLVPTPASAPMLSHLAETAKSNSRIPTIPRKSPPVLTSIAGKLEMFFDGDEFHQN